MYNFLTRTRIAGGSLFRFAQLAKALNKNRLIPNAGRDVCSRFHPACHDKKANSNRLTRGPRPIPHRKLRSGGDGLFPKRFQPRRFSLWDDSPPSCLLHRSFRGYYNALFKFCLQTKSPQKRFDEADFRRVITPYSNFVYRQNPPYKSIFHMITASSPLSR